MGVILEGEEIEGGYSGEVRRLRGVIPGGRRPSIGAEGPQLAKRACLPHELLVH